MIWCITAGLITGFVLGFVGAGGAIVGVPVLLFLMDLEPHMALGTNAAGVALICAGLLVWRAYHKEVPFVPGIIFALPGIPGIYFGARLGLAYPGEKLVFLLGLLLFVVAGWMVYLSTQLERIPSNVPANPVQTAAKMLKGRRVVAMAVTAFAIGLASGFFGFGGAFMIVPALIIVGGLPLAEAVPAALIPIFTFATVVAVEYTAAGSARLSCSALMLAGGMAGGTFGVWLSKRLSKVFMQRVLALFLVALGFYIVLR